MDIKEEPEKESSDYGQLTNFLTTSPTGSPSTWAYDNTNQKRSSSLPQKTNIFLTDLQKEVRIGSQDELARYASLAQRDERYSVCVIENISPEYVELIRSAWGVDSRFFATHASNPQRETIWDNRRYAWGRKSPDEADNDDIPRFEYLDGIYEYHGLKLPPGQTLSSSPNNTYRHCYMDGSYPVQSNTRISYYRVNHWLYLFLVDAPLDIAKYHARSSPSLRLLYAMNRGGLQLPALLSTHKGGNNITHSVFDILRNFFRHAWHLDVIFFLPCRSDGAVTAPPPSSTQPDTIPPHALLYLLSHSVHESNFRHLKAEISYISFHSIRYPSPSINNTLHDLRQFLSGLESNLTETITYVPEKVKTYFLKQHPYYTQPRYYSRHQTPIEEHERVLTSTKELSSFLMQTFQLFISSITVQESQLNSELARRSTQITQLAFIYIPLSFVTGVFGMNIVELNGQGVHIWVCFVVFGVVAFVTLAIFIVLHCGFKRQARGRAGGRTGRMWLVGRPVEDAEGSPEKRELMLV